MLKFSLLILTAFGQIFAQLDSPKIIGGFLASPGQYPYSAALKYFKSRRHFCGAGILSKRWILTAAHCIRWKGPDDFVVYVGSIYLDRWGKHYYVEKILIHPDFSFINPYIDDISMIKLEEDLEFDENVKPINLPIDINVKPGALATAIGWGDTKYPGEASPNQLQFLTRRIISGKYCGDVLQYKIQKQHLCFGGDLGHGLCHGDSGSPLIYVASNKTYIIGLVSWGHPCGVGYPDVFTRVSYFVPWILDKLVA